MARIALIGGHGKVALLAEPLLVDAGHSVSAIIRNPDHRADIEATGATPVVADIETMDTEALTQLLGDHDVVVWSAGAGGSGDYQPQPADAIGDARDMAQVSLMDPVNTYVNADRATKYGILFVLLVPDLEPVSAQLTIPRQGPADRHPLLPVRPVRSPRRRYRDRARDRGHGGGQAQPADRGACAAPDCPRGAASART